MNLQRNEFKGCLAALKMEHTKESQTLSLWLANFQTFLWKFCCHDYIPQWHFLRLHIWQNRYKFIGKTDKIILQKKAIIELSVLFMWEHPLLKTRHSTKQDTSKNLWNFFLNQSKIPSTISHMATCETWELQHTEQNKTKQKQILVYFLTHRRWFHCTLFA